MSECDTGETAKVVEAWARGAGVWWDYGGPAGWPRPTITDYGPVPPPWDQTPEATGLRAGWFRIDYGIGTDQWFDVDPTSALVWATAFAFEGGPRPGDIAAKLFDRPDWRFGSRARLASWVDSLAAARAVVADYRESQTGRRDGRCELPERLRRDAELADLSGWIDEWLAGSLDVRQIRGMRLALLTKTAPSTPVSPLPDRLDDAIERGDDCVVLRPGEVAGNFRAFAWIPRRARSALAVDQSRAGYVDQSAFRLERRVVPIVWWRDGSIASRVLDLRGVSA